jgi:hypothetical protein
MANGDWKSIMKPEKYKKRYKCGNCEIDLHYILTPIVSEQYDVKFCEQKCLTRYKLEKNLNQKEELCNLNL